MEFLYFFLGLLLGAFLVYLWTRSQVATTAQKLSADLAVAKSQLETAQKNAELKKKRKPGNHAKSKEIKEEGSVLPSFLLYKGGECLTF